MPAQDRFPSIEDRNLAIWIELVVQLAVVGLLLYWSFTLLRPFIAIMIWSLILTVALYPVYDLIVHRLGGRRQLAAALLTIGILMVVVGPATWLTLSLVEGLKALADGLRESTFALPTPPVAIKNWPLIGDPIYQFWELASTNFQAALVKIVPQLKPVGSVLVRSAGNAGTATIQFLIAIVIAGFLFSPAPALLQALKALLQRVASERGETLVSLAATTIRAVSRGVIGISVLQTLAAGIGLLIIGIPGAGLITSAVLILGILQIGPSIVLIPIIIWSWVAKDTMTAILFTAYMVPVGLMDNLLRPLVLGRGLDTPMLIILLGVIGGTVSYGITGLFLGPVVLAVMWNLLVAWVTDRECTSAPSPYIETATSQSDRHSEREKEQLTT